MQTALTCSRATQHRSCMLGVLVTVLIVCQSGTCAAAPQPSLNQHGQQADGSAAERNSSSLPSGDLQSHEYAHDGLSADLLKGYQQDFPAMGTLVTLKAFSADREQVQSAFDDAIARVQELEAILTDYDPSSETRRLTDLAVRQPHPVSDDLWEVLLASDQWFSMSEGVFDSSLGQLTRLWRRHRRAGKIPENDQILAALGKCGWQHVQLDRQARTIRFQQPEVALDFGGIGKGYIVDQAFQVLLRHGLDCCLVNISGNMRCGRPPPDRDGWRIEIAPLERDGKPLRRIRLANQAVATSGDLWQAIIIDGQRRSHILDPSTGIGVLGPIASTVVARDAATADAAATAACVLGPEKTLQRLDTWRDGLRQPELEALVARRVPLASGLRNSPAGARAEDEQRRSGTSAGADLQLVASKGFPRDISAEVKDRGGQ